MTTNEGKRNQVIELWNAGLKDPTAIGKKTKLAPNTVRTILRKEGLLGPFQSRRTKQVRVSTVGSPTQVNQYEMQQPQQGEEIKVLLQKITLLTTDLEKAKEQVRSLVITKEIWTQEKKQLQIQIVEKTDQNEAITQERRRDQEEQKKKVKKIEDDTTAMQYEYRKILEKTYKGINLLIETLENRDSQIKIFKGRFKQLEENAEKQKIEQKKESQKNSVIAFGLGTGLGVGIGVLVNWIIEQLFPRLILNPSSPQRVEARKIMRCYPLPDDDINNGVPLETTSSGACCSGSFSYNNGDNNTSGYGVFPTQQNEVIQSGSGGTNGTNMSGIPCFGAFSCNTLGNNYIEPFIQNPQFIQNPPLLPMTNLTFPSFTPIVPLPEELSGVNFGIRPKKMSGPQFVALFQWAAPKLGFKVTPMKKTRDGGCDLLLEKDGIKIVAQLKQQQKKIGVDAVYAVHAAQDHYHADKAMIVVTNGFTRPTLELAKEFEIECWDWQRLCTEFRNHNVSYPME